jgi:ABC-2 type transport system permease protein
MTANVAVPAAVRPVERFDGLVREVAVLAGRNLRRARTARSIRATVVSPLVFFVAFWAVLHKLLAGRGVDVDQFLPPAIVAQSATLIATTTAFFLAVDRRSGMVARCRSLPISGAAMPLARLLVDGLRATVSVTVIVAAGYVAGFRFQAGPVAAAGFVAVGVALALALAAGTAALGLSARDPEAVGPMLSLPSLPLVSLSSAFVPVGTFPGWLQPVVKASPVTAAVDAMRALATGGPILVSLGQAVAWITGLSIVFCLVAVRAFRRGP